MRQQDDAMNDSHSISERVRWQDLLRVCKVQLDEDTAAWLEHKVSEIENQRSFVIAFGLIPRKVPRESLAIDQELETQLKMVNPGFDPNRWTLDDFCRLTLLLSLDVKTNRQFLTSLVGAADMREQVVIFRALPLLPNAPDFVSLAIDGLRTNMTDVFDAIALDSGYPLKYFPDDAWNQMVLKAIFMQRPIYRIVGVDERCSAKLTGILRDFAHERWSAGRDVTPELWRLVRKYIDQEVLADLQHVINNDVPLAAQAAIKAIEESNNQDALEWLHNNQLNASNYSWTEIGQKIVRS